MKQEKLISIIVPIYDTASYLERCIKGIINQSYSNIEVLLINNITCSQTGFICNKYAELDKRIRVINVFGISVGAARNIGIENATGEYIGFVDSDDYIKTDMYEVLLKNIVQHNADVSMIKFFYEENGEIQKKKLTNKIEILNQTQALQEVLKDKKIQSFVWDKLFKREILKDLRFDENRVFEDIDIMYKVLQKIDKFVYIDMQKYVYVQRENSIMHVHNSQYILDRLHVIMDRYNNIKNMQRKELDFENSYAFVVNMVVIFRSIVLNQYDDIYNDFMKYFDLFIEIVNKYKQPILEILTPNQKIVLDLMLTDINSAPQKIRNIKDIEK